jgi:CRP-like cAMP-binding protein
VLPLQERVPFTLPAQLCKVVMRALAIDRADRHKNAMELKFDIEKFLRTYSFFPRVTFKEGELLFAEGDEGDSVYIIISGMCEVFTTEGGEETHLSELNRGDVFGEIAVFTKRQRTASVRALTTVNAIRVTRNQILHDGELGYWVTFITKALAERFLEDELKIKALEKRLRQFESLSSLPLR